MTGECLGRSHRGLSSKIHLALDGRGLPINGLLADGQAGDTQFHDAAFGVLRCAVRVVMWAEQPVGHRVTVAVAADPPGDGGDRDLESFCGPPVGLSVVDDGIDEALSSRGGKDALSRES